jgi:hypothetical protein
MSEFNARLFTPKHRRDELLRQWKGQERRMSSGHGMTRYEARRRGQPMGEITPQTQERQFYLIPNEDSQRPCLLWLFPVFYLLLTLHFFSSNNNKETRFSGKRG